MSPIASQAAAPTTITSLPEDIIAHLATFLCRSDAISLALTSRHFIIPCEISIWRTLDFTLPADCGDTSWMIAAAGTSVEEQEDSLRLGSAWGHTCRLAELKRKIQRVLREAGRSAKIADVWELTVMPRPGVLYGLIQLLELLSKSLERITFETISPSSFLDEPCLTLDFKLADADLTFPFLTHLHFGPGTVTLSHSLPFLQMQIYIHEPHEDRDPSENSDNSDGEWFSTIAPLISILDRSPLLRQLSISPMNATWYYGVFDGLIEMQTVQDLHCQASHSDIENLELENASAKCLGSARRLALESTGWSNVFRIPTGFPNLELFCLILRGRSNSLRPFPPSPNLSESVSMCTLLPRFAHQLRNMPRLQHLHILLNEEDEDRGLDIFCELDICARSEEFTGSVRSYRYNMRELLHVRLLLGYIQVEDEVCTDGCYEWASATPYTPYEGADGIKRHKVFAKLDSPIWQDWTDLDGKIVPLSILDKMKVAETASDEEWNQRGVQVGEKGWEIIRTWEWDVRMKADDKKMRDLREKRKEKAG